MRHSNRRYNSSIIKNRDLLHNYLVVPITTHTHVRRKSIRKKKRKRQKKKKGHYIPIQDHPVSSRSRRSLLLSVVGNIYMAVSMPGHGDLFALLMSRMALSWRSGHQLYRFIPRSSVCYELRSHGNFLPYASTMQENPRKY